jgi:hypothetical protein
MFQLVPIAKTLKTIGPKVCDYFAIMIDIVTCPQGIINTHNTLRTDSSFRVNGCDNTDREYFIVFILNIRGSSRRSNLK